MTTTKNTTRMGDNHNTPFIPPYEWDFASGQEGDAGIAQLEMCAYCNNMGHITKQCPIEKKYANLQGKKKGKLLVRQRIICDLCELHGHGHADCPHVRFGGRDVLPHMSCYRHAMPRDIDPFGSNSFWITVDGQVIYKQDTYKWTRTDQTISDNSLCRIPADEVRQFDLTTKKMTNLEWYKNHTFYGCTFVTCPYLYTNYHENFYNLAEIQELPTDFSLLRLTYVTEWQWNHIRHMFTHYIKYNAYERGLKETPWDRDEITSERFLGPEWTTMQQHYSRLTLHVSRRRAMLREVEIPRKWNDLSIRNHRIWRIYPNERPNQVYIEPQLMERNRVEHFVRVLREAEFALALNTLNTLKLSINTLKYPTQYEVAPMVPKFMSGRGNAMAREDQYQLEHGQEMEPFGVDTRALEYMILDMKMQEMLAAPLEDVGQPTRQSILKSATHEDQVPGCEHGLPFGACDHPKCDEEYGYWEPAKDTTAKEAQEPSTSQQQEPSTSRQHFYQQLRQKAEEEEASADAATRARIWSALKEAEQNF